MSQFVHNRTNWEHPRLSVICNNTYSTKQAFPRREIKEIENGRGAKKSQFPLLGEDLPSDEAPREPKGAGNICNNYFPPATKGQLSPRV